MQHFWRPRSAHLLPPSETWGCASDLTVSSSQTFAPLASTHPPLWLTGSVTQRPSRNVLTNCSGMGASTKSSSSVAPAQVGVRQSTVLSLELVTAVTQRQEDGRCREGSSTTGAVSALGPAASIAPLKDEHIALAAPRRLRHQQQVSCPGSTTEASLRPPTESPHPHQE